MLTAWAALFYMAVMEEVNDEVDDSQTDMLFGTIPVRPLIVAGAGNGGGDAAYSGTPTISEKV